MHTPAGFNPSHLAPVPLPGTALAFAFAKSRLLVCGDEQAPAVPPIADLEHAGLDGARHYLGRLDGIDCVAVTLPDDTVAPAGSSSSRSMSSRYCLYLSSAIARFPPPAF